MNAIRTLALPLAVVTLAACGTRPALRNTPDADFDRTGRLFADLDQRAQDGETPQAESEGTTETGSDWEGSFSALLGGRALDDDRFWDPVDSQFAGGIEFEMRPRDLPIGFEAGFQFGVGYEEDINAGFTDATSAIGEFYLGPRLTLELGDSVRPYVGGGATFLSATLENETPLPGGGRQIREDDDSTIGAYAHAGVQVDLADGFHVGVDARGVFGTDLTLFGTGTDADYFQVALTLGGNW